jgi:23S rRNA (pseudouridine1915-N3)-methyltransferase
VRIRIIIVGKVRERYLRDGVAEYLKRLGPYAHVELLELQDEPVPETSSDKQLAAARQVEAERILRTLRDSEYLVALDIRGTGMSSEDLSRWIQERAVSGDSNLAFVIGGTTGLAPEVLSRARLRLSMGPMTFPHQFMPMLVAEQLYRAFRIGRGEPYHR